MKIARMNQRITFQHYRTSTDTDGYTFQQWTDYYTCWCHANNLSGNEFWAAMTNNAEQTVVFTIRNCKKIKAIDTENYRILFAGIPYDITFIDDMQYSHKDVQIKATAKTRGKENGKV